MQFCVLGPLEVRRGGEPVPIGSSRQRGLLAALIVHAGQVVSVDALVDALWGDQPPADPRNAIQTYIARLRDTLGESVPLLTRRPGYLLEVEADQVDALVFERLVDQAVACRKADPAGARQLLDEALALWRGEPYAEFADSFAGAEALRLTERRLVAVEERAAARLALGESAAVASELQGWVEDHPLRERPVALLMRALADQERSAEALAVYRVHRDRLAEETGLEPSEAIQRLQGRILRGELDAARPREAGRRPADARPVPVPAVPAVPTALVGRDREVAEARTLLADRRLVTLTGTGGVGKTRIAAQVATAVGRGQHREVAWVDLAPLSDPAAVEHVVADATDVDVTGAQAPREALVAGLAARELLLVLDNCEHLLAALAPLVEQLHRRCPRLQLLATSRERLAVDGEHVLPVQPLPVGDPGEAPVAPAVRLFVARAEAAAPHLDLSRRLSAVAEVCRQLDGLPLAIELAAARVGAVGLEELAAHLREGRPGAVGHRRGRDARHRDLRAVVDWSYQLLAPDEQHLFERLSVFAGAFTVDDAHAVCAGGDRSRAATVEGLASLAESSMLTGPREPAGRYRMLRTLQRFARERLADRGEAAQLADRHAEVFTRRAEEAAGTRPGGGATEAGWLEAAFDDLRAAHRRARLTGNVDLVARLSAALYRFEYWRLRAEVMGWAGAALELDGLDEHPAAPQVYAAAAVAAWLRGAMEQARRLARHGIGLGGDGDDPVLRFAYEALGDVALFEGQPQEAEAAWREEMRLARAAADRDSEVVARGSVAVVNAYQGRTGKALEHAEAAERAGAEASPSARAFARYVQGECRVESDPDRAMALVEEAIELATACGASFVEGVARVTAASLRGRHGQPATAVPAFAELLRHWRRSGNWTQQWTTLRNLAELLVRLQLDEPAVVLLAAAEAAETAAPSFGAEADRTEQALATTRERLGRPAFTAARERGEGLEGPAAVELALATLEELQRS